jgi:RimJ/RimL family protein N-acetyltransferase
VVILEELSPFDAVLRDGRRVRLRPVSRDDAPKLADALGRMSRQSRYFRFHRHVERLTEQQLHYLTDLDYERHVAWAAVSLDEPGEPGAGLARFVRDDADGSSGEFAVAVVDAYQGVGLGQLLMETLLCAAGLRGVRELRASVLADNHGALRLFERLGGRTSPAEDDTLVVRIPITSIDRTRRASSWFPAAVPGRISVPSQTRGA